MGSGAVNEVLRNYFRSKYVEMVVTDSLAVLAEFVLLARRLLAVRYLAGSVSI
jgi:hypothetical protein